MFRAIRFELISTFGSLLTIFLAMLLPGIIWVTSKNLSKTESELRRNITMDVFLKDNLTNDDISRLRQDFIKLKGVRNATYISKEEAFEKMRLRFGSEMLQGLDENPLPASFTLNVDQTLLMPGAAETLSKKLKSYSEVDDVVFAVEILSRLGRIMRSFDVIGMALSVLVAFAAIFIVGNTVRVAILDRRKTVEIMQLVGATRGYILTPFVFLGGTLGILGAIFSAVALSLTSDYISAHLMKIIFLEPLEILAFILTGLALGMLGAVFATQKYLKI
jgi:cell division transport system permease protein